LAISFAQAGKSVILIDGNLRRPRLAALFGLAGDHGLSDLLHPGVDLPQPQSVPSFANLLVLPAGTPTPAASEILASERMRQLLDACTARADIVILDSPPLVYSDALALAPCVDGVLLVAKSGATSRQNLVSAVESLQLVGAKVLGTVLNQVKPGPAYSYYPMHAGKPAAPSFTQPKGNLAVEYSARRSEPAERVN
jgi:capsular exopolysaccharide synthesis family protein